MDNSKIRIIFPYSYSSEGKNIDELDEETLGDLLILIIKAIKKGEK